MKLVEGEGKIMLGPYFKLSIIDDDEEKGDKRRRMRIDKNIFDTCLSEQNYLPSHLLDRQEFECNYCEEIKSIIALRSHSQKCYKVYCQILGVVCFCTCNECKNLQTHFRNDIRGVYVDFQTNLKHILSIISPNSVLNSIPLLSGSQHADVSSSSQPRPSLSPATMAKIRHQSRPLLLSHYYSELIH